MLVEEASSVVKAAIDSAGSMVDLRQAAQSLLSKAQGAAAADAADAIATMGFAVRAADADRAAFVAMVCGAMIERGANPAGLVEPLLHRIGVAAAAARQLFDVAAAEVPRDSNPDEARSAMAAALERGGAAKPALRAGWSQLEALFPPAIATFSASGEARRRGRPLAGVMAPLAGFSNAANWLSKVVSVLEDEPYVAIDPLGGVGVVGRMSGISENFQLNVLLMDAFPRKLLSKPRVSAAAAGIARGDGPQQGMETITAVWNLLAWTAVGTGGSLPDPKSYDHTHWIWNEGVPADIPTFDGHRVIILGPPSYLRTWKSQRDFAGLRASLGVDRRMGKSEVQDWIKRLAAAPK